MLPSTSSTGQAATIVAGSCLRISLIVGGILLGAGRILALIVGVFVYSAVTLEDRPANATKSYVAAIREGRISDAWNTMCPSFKAANPEETFSGSVARAARARGGVVDYTTGDVDLTSSAGRILASVDYTVTFGDGSTVDSTFSLEKQDRDDGDWMVCNRPF